MCLHVLSQMYSVGWEGNLGIGWERITAGITGSRVIPGVSP